jgi:peptide/nickel transport system permease protein
LRWLARNVAIILLTALLGGLAGATLVRFAPGFGVDERELDMRLNASSVEALRQTNGQHENLLAFYAHYLGRILHGDLGYSSALQRPISELLPERLPDTLKSVGLGLLLGWSLGLTLAVAVVMSRAVSLDFFATLVAGLLLCLPAAALAILFFLARAPARLAIGLIIFPKVFRYARNLLLRSSKQPHVLTAKAKGLSDARVLLYHILPSVGPQLLALAGVSVSLAFGAAIPVEVLCGLPGIGQLAWQAALARDLQLLISLTMIITVITLVANSASGLLNKREVGAA